MVPCGLIGGILPPREPRSSLAGGFRPLDPTDWQRLRVGGADRKAPEAAAMLGAGRGAAQTRARGTAEGC
eukprot:10959070-Alexandrium_andersonii.AAC.1